MEKNKKDLAKKAFAALMLASSLTVAGHAEGAETQSGTSLSFGCGGSKSGCGAAGRAGCGATPRAGCGATTNPAGSTDPYGSDTESTYSTGRTPSSYNRPGSTTSTYGGYDTTSGTYSGSSNYYPRAGSSSGYSYESYNPRPGSMGGSTEDYSGTSSSGSPTDPSTRRNPSNWNR